MTAFSVIFIPKKYDLQTTVFAVMEPPLEGNETIQMFYVRQVSYQCISFMVVQYHVAIIPSVHAKKLHISTSYVETPLYKTTIV